MTSGGQGAGKNSLETISGSTIDTLEFIQRCWRLLLTSYTSEHAEVAKLLAGVVLYEGSYVKSELLWH